MEQNLRWKEKLYFNALDLLTKVLHCPKKLCVLSQNIYVFSQNYREYLRSLTKHLYTLKNKGASHGIHRRTFLSKWFHKEPLTYEEPFSFTKGSLWRKIIKK